MNLIDRPYREFGNYLCTWTLQEMLARKLDVRGDNMPMKQRNVLDENHLFGTDFYHIIQREQRAGLYFLLDDGWDVPYDVDSKKGTEMFGSLCPCPEKFPSFGGTPVEILKNLNEKVKEMGYCGLGLWVSPQIAFEEKEQRSTPEQIRAYWLEKARISEEAGIRYWKVDWGKYSDTENRRIMTECAREAAPSLRLEHATPQNPFESASGEDDPRTKSMRERVVYSDFFRTYDLAPPFDNSETLARIHWMLSGLDTDKFTLGAKGIINVEDQPMVAAGLSCSVGIMRGSVEDIALLNWQRLAPPMPTAGSTYVFSEEWVEDKMFIEHNPVWWVDKYNGTEFSVRLPAVMARNTRLPKVACGELAPIVLASCNSETKAFCVSALRRAVDPNPRLAVPADITVYPDDMNAPVGVFGVMNSLTLEFAENIPAEAKIYAQCLLDDEAFDVTGEVSVRENTLYIDGKKIRLWGHGKQYPTTDHEPVLVIKIIE